jgi:hypothetical protein
MAIFSWGNGDDNPWGHLGQMMGYTIFRQSHDNPFANCFYVFLEENQLRENLDGLNDMSSCSVRFNWCKCPIFSHHPTRNLI